MKGHVAPQVKNRRSDTLHKIGKEASLEFFRSNEGNTQIVLPEEIYGEKNMVTGYTGNYIKVYIDVENMDDAGKLINRMVKVRLKEAFADGMKGEIVL